MLIPKPLNRYEFNQFLEATDEIVLTFKGDGKKYGKQWLYNLLNGLCEKAEWSITFLVEEQIISLTRPDFYSKVRRANAITSLLLANTSVELGLAAWVIELRPGFWLYDYNPPCIGTRDIQETTKYLTRSQAQRRLRALRKRSAKRFAEAEIKLHYFVKVSGTDEPPHTPL